MTFWDGERVDDITAHPRFTIPIADTAASYAGRLEPVVALQAAADDRPPLHDEPCVRRGDRPDRR